MFRHGGLRSGNLVRCPASAPARGLCAFTYFDKRLTIPCLLSRLIASVDGQDGVPAAR